MGFLKNLFKAKKINNNKVATSSTNDSSFKLGIGDIILLYWIQTSVDTKFPAYFEYDYKINPQKHRNMLINLGLLSYQKSHTSLQKLKVPQLKDILRKHNLPVSGKKDVLVQRIMDSFNDLENDIPQTLCLTEQGQKVIDENGLLIQAHKDQFIDVVRFDKLLRYNPNSTYEQLKEALLREDIATHKREMNFGLVRNAHYSLADMYDGLEQYPKALRHYLEVILLDCSGLGNSYNFTKQPIYEDCFINSNQVTKMRNCAEECDLDEYNLAFQQAVTDIKSFKAKIFLSDKDLKFLQEKLLTEDLTLIENYLHKFEKYTFDYYL